jgi:predicted RNA binding protein YcfA (HicA-like mRNA interferase family)
MLKRVGFVNRGGKGGRRNFSHPSGIKITLSGNLGHDAKKYQEKATEKAIREARR